ncbi:restin homolog isoform X4 [Anastrepha obliqua]|uniref:restin homolog isoform X4 n=2 Tax=Anastrepha obliqua TaxID=95512 RepID=UPI002409CED8|nr:restin homolog isoform X4 [Anastrepha obliqua]
MSDNNYAGETASPMLPSSEATPPADGAALLETKTMPVQSKSVVPPSQATTAASLPSTPASSITGGPTSRLRAPTNYGGDTAGSVAKIGRLCSHAIPKAGPPPRDLKSMSRDSDDTLSSINSTYTDHGAVLTHDTEQFIIGQKVWVGGIRPGQIAYIGETHFAPGDWAGIVLDEPNGKNDGCVAGKRYFQCEPRRGIFSRLTRLTLAPFSGAQTPTSPLAKMSPDRSRTVSPTASIRSSFLRSSGKNGLTVGDRIIVSSGFGSRPGILRYLGETQFASGNWCGVELDEPSGKNDGSVDGVKYFECRPKYGVFVPIAKVSLSPSSKKSRLSRTGSRESLNSIGTMNSIATTNTSRLRMNAQRKSLSIKPIVATPKSQYSMQDILHEKQKHIEQLMIERELDREDCQNQALQYQKNINELKSRIVQLERSLDDERKKSEDLQFSIDEATYCGNDVQANVYKEKIQALEKKLSDLSIGTIKSDLSAEDTSAVDSATADAATAKISELTLQLQKQKDEYEVRLIAIEDEQKRLQENTEYLRNENDTLQKELLEKDESLEKFSLSACGIQNLRHELDLLKEEAEKERQQLQADFFVKLEEKDVLLNTISAELTAQKNTLITLESKRSNTEDECQILRNELQARDAQLHDVNEQLSKLKAEFSMQKAENATLEELLKNQQAGTIQAKTQLEEKLLEIKKLEEDVVSLQTVKKQSEMQLKSAKEEVKHLAELQQSLEEKLKAATTADQDKIVAMTQLGMVMEELKKQISNVTVENENLKSELKKQQEANAVTSSTEAELRRILKDTDQEYKEKLEEYEKSNLNLEEKLKSETNKSHESLNKKMQEIEALNNEIGQLQQRIKTLECDSSASVQQLNSRLNKFELEAKKLKEDVKSAENALKEKADAYTQLERVLAEKVDTLNSNITALDTTNNLVNKLKQELDTTLAKCSELEATKNAQREQCSQQQLEIGDLTRKLDSLNIKCDSLKTQNGALENDVASAHSNFTELQYEVRKLNEELATRQKHLLEVQTNNNDERLKLESQIEEIGQKLANASKELEQEHANTERARTEISTKTKQLTVLEEKTIKLELALSDGQRQHENLQTKYESLAAQNKTLEEYLNTLRTTSIDSNSELLKISQQVAAEQRAYDELLDKTNTDRAILEGQLQASQQRIDTLCSQVETLTQEIKTATEESFKRIEIFKLEEEKCGKQELELGNLSRKLEALMAKCTGLESENEQLQKDLATLHDASTDSSAVITKLSEELTQKNKLLQDFTDKSTADRLQLDNQLQELEQRLQSNLHDSNVLRSELEAALEAKSAQAKEFETLKLDLQTQSSSQLNVIKEKEAAERKIIENFETQLKSAEQTKGRLDEAISSLQQQIKLLQDELLKSQLDFKSKEEELDKQITSLTSEAEKLRERLEQAQIEGSSTLNIEQLQKAELQKKIDSLQSELETTVDQLLTSRGEAEQLKLAQINALEDTIKLQDQLKVVQNALDLANTEKEFRTKIAEEDKIKMEELRNMVEVVQAANANISATNAEMSEALRVLEQEKCETANIFELFEMESDQNMENLSEKLIDIKQKLADAQTQLQLQSTAITEKQMEFESVAAKLEASQAALVSVQATLLDRDTKINELSTAYDNLQKTVKGKEQQLQEHTELQNLLAEYKKVIDEMDEAASAKGTELHHLQERIKSLEQENLRNMEAQKTLKMENSNLQRLLEVLELEKTREIIALQSREVHAINTQRQNNLAAGVPKEVEETEDNTAQINFLNSIIADMQKKNDSLKAKIEALETLPTDYTQPKAFELIAKRKPAPRVFCDICDEFDKHETEDCPLQASDVRDYSPPPLNNPAKKADRKLPEPRKYCETCEVFGHETGECEDDEW